MPCSAIVDCHPNLSILPISAGEEHKALGKGGGAQGYCAGLLPAVAIAASANEVELIENTCRALRIALVIGAYADLGDEDLSGGPTNIVVRLKYEGQGEKILEGFPRVSQLSCTKDSIAEV